MLGYKLFEDWNSDPNHVYIGRNMSHHVAGALGSKWGNPFTAKKGNRNSRKKCLERYENHVRKNPDLFNAVMELEGKELGCWCKPSPCHGDILIKLFKERQNTNPCSSKFDHQEFTPALTQCSGRLKNIQSNNSPSIVGGETPPEFEGNEAHSIFATLRLRGGGDTSNEYQENMDNIENQTNSMFADNPSISSPSNHDSQYVSNKNEPLSFVNQDDSMSEQDIRDILLNAGYTMDDINDAITSKSKSNVSVSQTSMEQSLISESVPAIDNISGREPPERNPMTQPDTSMPV